MREPRRKLAGEESLYEAAVRALARRMRSVAELKRLLRARAAPGCEPLLEAVITRLKRQGYVNDTAYAAAYAVLRRENQKFGPRRVRADLAARGVHPEVIAEAVKQCYAAGDDAQLARDFLRRRRIGRPRDSREAARAFRALLRAGFSPEVSLRILKTWKVDDDTLSALESEAEAELNG